MHRTLFTPQGGSWARFSQYLCRDGYIVPHSRAKLASFDMWQALLASKTRPYDALGRIASDASSFVLGESTVLDRSVERSIENWCAEFGCLGILPQRVKLIVLSPRHELRGAGKGAPMKKVLAQPWYKWPEDPWGDNGDWDLFSEPIQRRRDAAEPFVRIGNLGTIDLWSEPLATTWARFFPKVPLRDRQTFQYPKPFETAFWRQYREPVQDFLEAAELIRAALTGIARPYRPDGIDATNFWLGHLNNLASSARFIVRATHEREFLQQWDVPTMYAALAMMALQDLSAQGTPRVCPICQVQFGSSAYQARYCSMRCRQTANKRAYRARRPAARSAV